MHRCWPWLLGVAILLVTLAGCGGANVIPQVKAAEPEPQLVTMHFLDHKYTLPHATAPEQFQLSTRVWESQDAPLHGQLKITMPFAGKAPRPSGPVLPARDDGVNKLPVPVFIYWGEGEAVTKGQPVGVAPGMWLPGYRRPSADLYLYDSLLLLDNPIPVAGAYTLSDNETSMRTWTVPAGLEMLAPVEVTEPSLVANIHKPLVAKWSASPKAGGYLVVVEGDQKDPAGAVARHLVWTSAGAPMTLESVYDVTPYLLAGTTRQVTIPANIFVGCETITINVLAVAPVFEDKSAKPAVRMEIAALTSHMVVCYK